METDNSRHVLFLVGMHRSGTSALCAALQACGASFGSGLLEPMERVNELGFWESSEVVALNERLLLLAGAHWYSVTPLQLQIDWTGPKFELERREAAELLQRGFGHGPLEVVKDPRLCITLPFWLALCKDKTLRTSVCVMTRAPIEVCKSLEDRDGFPQGYGIRLLRTYLRGIVTSVPPDTLYATYDRLLDDPVDLLRELEKALPLAVNEEGLISAVLAELKHQDASREDNLIALRDCKNIDFNTLETQIEELYPVESTLTDFACRLVHRGRELTRIGEAHTQALQTLKQRDSEVEELRDELAQVHQKLHHIGDLHTQALATVRERDGQIKNFDLRLQEIGNLHSRALVVIEERDKQQKDFSQRLTEIGNLHTQALHVIDNRESRIIELERTVSEMELLKSEALANLGENNARLQRIFKKPGVGYLFRAMWKHETS